MCNVSSTFFITLKADLDFISILTYSLMNNPQPQQLVQMQMLADVNVLMKLKDFKPIPFGWEMSNVVLQFFVQSKGNLKLWQYFWHLTVMLKINLVELKVPI